MHPMSICDLTADDDDAVLVASTLTSPPCLNPPTTGNTLPSTKEPTLEHHPQPTHPLLATPIIPEPSFIDLTTTPDPESPALTMARRTRARTPPPERPADHSHSLRERKPPAGTYVVSDDSDDDDLQASQGYKDRGDVSSSSEEEEESEPEPEPEVPRERSSAGGRSLRAAATLKPPPGLADMVSTDMALATRKKSKRKKSKTKAKPRPKKAAKRGDEECELTVRGEIRQALEETKKKRDAFFLKNRELFEDLLPESNYISKLADKELDLPTPVEYKLLDKQPKHVKATMKSYQLSGLSFLVWLYNNGSNGILGDEMGLGKTLQTLSLFSYLTTYKPEPHHRPFLVVCPLSVVSSWMAEAKKWVPHLKCLRFHGPASERARMKQVAESGEIIGFDDSESVDDDAPQRGYDIIVTSYEVFEREKQWFRRAFVWRYVVLDEGHKIKNEKTNISQALQGLSAEFRLILTGTPLQNNLTELWALLHWLFPDVFQDNTSKLFTDAFDLTNGKNNLTVLDNSRKLLELIMLRRMKESKGVNLGLPPKTELVMFLPLTPMQRFWYKRLLTRLDKGLLEGLYADSKDKAAADVKEDPDSVGGLIDDKDLEKMGDMENTDEWGETKQMMEKAVKESKGDGKWQKLMNLLMQLRKCCNHPFLLPSAEPDDDDHEARASALILASSKFIFLDKLIQELCINQGKKVLIFSGFTKMLDVCEDFLEMKSVGSTKFKYGRLDGTTARARRNLAIRLFNNDPGYKVMLISTRAGGLGINLASASDVVMLESDWNPQADLQAQARAHRIGQVNPVTIYRLITQGTVEEQMMGRIRKKLYLSAKVTESMRDIHTSTSGSANLNKSTEEDDGPTLSTSQLMSLVRSGSRAIAHPEIDPADMLKWDWETTIHKCHEYAEKLQAEAKAVSSASDPQSDAKAEAEWLSQMERVESRVFEGKAHSTAATSTNSAIADDWSREQRRHGMNRVVMIDGHPVLKETIGNNEWEAVKTFAGRDPSLRGPEKRKRTKIEHQDHCQVCFDGGEVISCAGCPRVYHIDCLSESMQAKLNSRQNQFYCQQHECVECEQKTTNAGGLIYRCRWCDAGYCEDCLDWNKTELLGDQLLEYELLDFPQHPQAYYIKCVNCIARHKEDADARDLCADFETQWRVQKESKDLAEKEEAERAERDAEQRRINAENGKMEIDDDDDEGEDVKVPGLVGSELQTVDSSEVSTPASFMSAPAAAGDDTKAKRKRKASTAVPQKKAKTPKVAVAKSATGTPKSRGSRESTAAKSTASSASGSKAKKQKVLMVVNGQLQTGAAPAEGQ